MTKDELENLRIDLDDQVEELCEKIADARADIKLWIQERDEKETQLENVRYHLSAMKDE